MTNKKISDLTAATIPLDGTEVLPIVQSSTTKKVANNDLRPKQIQSNATSGVLQVTGPAAASTRVMTTPDANFTAARTDAAQTFSGLQTFGSGVSVTSGKLTTSYGGGGDFIAVFQNTTSATPYGVLIKDAATPTAGYPLLSVSNSAGTTVYLRVDSSNGDTTITSNMVVAAAAKGINFTANTPAAGKTSQLLNWYEEGTWTPNQGGGLTVVGAFSSSGTYTRIGRQVTVIGSVSGATSIAVNANSQISTNLPFASSVFALGSAMNNAGTAFSTTYIATSTIYSASAIGATTTISFQCTYFV